MPGVAPVIQELSAKHPDRAAEIFILGAIAGIAEQIAASRRRQRDRQTWPCRRACSISTTPLPCRRGKRLPCSNACSTMMRCGRKTATLRVLQVGYGPLNTVAPVAASQTGHRAYDRSSRTGGALTAPRVFLSKHGNVVLVGADQVAELGTFDLVVAVESLHRLPGSIGLSGVRQCWRRAGSCWPSNRHLRYFGTF